MVGVVYYTKQDFGPNAHVASIADSMLATLEEWIVQNYNGLPIEVTVTEITELR